MAFIQTGDDDGKLIVIVQYPDALPSVPPLYRDLAKAEIAREMSLAYSHLDSKFSEHYTDPEQQICPVVVPLKKRKGELEIIVLSTRHVDTDIIADWTRNLVGKPVGRWLQPGRDELFHLGALYAQEVAEQLHIEADCLEASKLEAVHSELWPGVRDIDFVFDFRAVHRDSDEPDETTFANVQDRIPVSRVA